MKSITELTELLTDEISRRGMGAGIVLARLANLLDAKAKTRLLENTRNLERSKERDLEQLKTYESVIALIDGLMTSESKEGIYHGIRAGRE